MLKLAQPALALAAIGTDAQNQPSLLLTLEEVMTRKLNAYWGALSISCTTAADSKHK